MEPITDTITDSAPAATDTKAEQKTSWRDLIKIHPAADAFPPLSEEELDALAEDIKENGLQNPIATWFDKDEQEWLIDGRNRLDALSRLGYKFSRVKHNASGVCTTDKLKIRNPNQRKEATGADCTALDNEWIHIHNYRETHTCGTFGWPIADPYVLAATFNLKRRQLTTEQKREITAKLLQAQPERSDRSIAKEVNLSPTTVGAIRETVQPSSVQNGQLGQEPAKRVGRDGKARKVPTKAAKAEPAAEPKSAGAPPPAAEASAAPPKAAPPPYGERPVLKEFFRLYQDVMDGGERLYAYAELKKLMGGA